VYTAPTLEGTTACVNAIQAAENTAQNKLPGLRDTLYSGVRSAAPSARVVVIDCPVFYQLDTFRIGLNATSRAKLDDGINILDGVISSAASWHGVALADVRSIFRGGPAVRRRHEVWKSDPFRADRPERAGGGNSCADIHRSDGDRCPQDPAEVGASR
jgi:hypothetical protein